MATRYVIDIIDVIEEYFVRLVAYCSDNSTLKAMMLFLPTLTKYGLTITSFFFFKYILKARWHLEIAVAQKFKSSR